MVQERINVPEWVLKEMENKPKKLNGKIIHLIKIKGEEEE